MERTVAYVSRLRPQARTVADLLRAEVRDGRVFFRGPRPAAAVNDGSLKATAESVGMKVIGVHELPVPDEDAQSDLLDILKQHPFQPLPFEGSDIAGAAVVQRAASAIGAGDPTGRPARNSATAFFSASLRS